MVSRHTSMSRPRVAGLIEDASEGRFTLMSLRLSGGHYYGETVRHRRVAWLILTEARYAPAVRLPRHCLRLTSRNPRDEGRPS
jgi:hypothetical protein